jgi:tetratricopeptide (TPR) repeat protein
MIFATLVGIVRGSHVILWLWLLGGVELLWGRERGEIDSLEALLRARKVSDTTLLSVYTSLARLYLSVEPAKALSYARQLSEKASKNNDLRRQVLGWYYQAAAHYQLGRYEESERTLVRAESLFQYMRPDTGILVQFKSLKAAIFESRREEVPKVLSAYQEALDLARASGQPRLRVMALNNLAEFYLNQGLYEAAQPLLQEALQLGQTGQEADHLYNTYLTLARYYQRQGKVDSALLVLHQVRQLGERTGVRKWVRESYSRSVQVVLEEGHIEKVDTLLRQGEAALRTDSLLLAEFLNQAASDLYVKGALNQAKTLWEKALQIAEAAPYPVVGIRVLMNLGSLYERQADYPKALEKFLQARSLCDKHQDTVRLPMVLMNIGNVYFAQEQYPKALEAYSEAARYAYLAENRDFPARVAANLAVSYAKLGDYETARRLLEESSLLADAEENWSAATTALINLTWIDIERGAYGKPSKTWKRLPNMLKRAKTPIYKRRFTSLRPTFIISRRPIPRLFGRTRRPGLSWRAKAPTLS